MAQDDYWQACEEEVQVLTLDKPTTAPEIVAILNRHDPHGPSAGDAFFSAANAGESLAETLSEIGWDIQWIEGDFHWKAHHSVTKETITYIEGDVYAS